MGSRPVSVQRIFLQGDYTETGNDYDMAIQGRGFFQVIRNDTEYYTRAGNFTLDSEGFIVTPDGYRLQPEFAVPVNSTINIDTGGLLVATDQDGNTVGSVQLTLNDFINPAGLKSVGENLFQMTDASGDPIAKNPGEDGAGTLLQRWLEMSNVDVVQETVNLIVVQRAFEINSQCIKTADQMLGIVNNLR
jgi:flagellar basal-body rod protein FlgG